MSIRKLPTGILGAIPEPDTPTIETSTVLAVGAGTVDVRTSDGTVYRHVPTAGSAVVGSEVKLQFVKGKPQAFGGGAGAAVGGAVVLSGSVSDIGAGLYVPLSRAINTTNGLTGGGTLAADLTLQVDSSVARAGWPVTGVGALGGGGGLSSTGITITMNTPGTITPSSVNNSAITNHTHLLDAGAAWTWGGLHTFNAGALIANNQSIGSPSFVSGFAGSGWRVDYGITTANRASAEIDNLTVRGLMRVYELLIHKIRTGNGSYLFAPGGKVKSVLGSGPYTIEFETDHGLAANDLIRAQKFDLGFGGLYQSNITVSSITNTTTLVGELSSGVAPLVGFEYARIGNAADTNRQGGVYVTADDSNAPYLDVFDGVASFADWGNSAKTKVRLGRLTGWGSHYPTMTYGFVTGKVDGLWLGVDATNGIRIMQNTTQVARWDTSGNITIGEVAASKANTFISAGEIQFRTNTTSYFKIASDGRVVLTQGTAATSALNWEAGGASLVAQVYGFRSGAVSYAEVTAYGYATTSGTVEINAYDVSNTALTAMKVLGLERRVESTRPLHLSNGGLYIGATFGALAFPSVTGIVAEGDIRSGSTVRGGTVLSDGAVYASNWLRTYGQTGWYSETYAGGWWMQDTTWIRSYNSKHVYVQNGGLLVDVPMAAYVYRTSAQSIPNATWTGISFNAVITDPWGRWDGNTAFYAQYSGYYQVSVRGTWASNATGIRMIAIVRNGTDFVDTQGMTAVSGTDHHMSVSFLVYMNAGSYVQMYVYQNSGGALNIGSSSNGAFYCRMGFVKVT